MWNFYFTIIKQYFLIFLFGLHFWAAYWSDEKGEVVLCNSIDISIAISTEKVGMLIQSGNVLKLLLFNIS